MPYAFAWLGCFDNNCCAERRVQVYSSAAVSAATVWHLSGSTAHVSCSACASWLAKLLIPQRRNALSETHVAKQAHHWLTSKWHATWKYYLGEITRQSWTKSQKRLNGRPPPQLNPDLNALDPTTPIETTKHHGAYALKLAWAVEPQSWHTVAGLTAADTYHVDTTLWVTVVLRMIEQL